MISLEERKEFLWKELNKLPNREVCKCATIKEIIRILQEVNVKDAREVFEDFEINLTVSEIPDGQIFETILYFLLAPEWNEDFLVYDEYIWNLSDEEGRTGYIENRYVQGYLAYWDALIELFPDMMLDSCASGGGRNDLETMRRSIPVHKSDYEYSAYDIKQSMHMSLFQWLPYFGTPIVGWTSTLDVDMYGARSGYCAWLGLFYNVTNVKLDWAAIKQIANEWTYVKDFYYADYYPLTKWSNTEKDWRGWEFFDEDLNKGYLQFFRPAGNKDAEGTYKLYGLDPNVTYKLTDVDGRCSTQATGKDLMETGFKVLLPEARTSALIYIEAIN